MENERAPLNLLRVELTGSFETLLACDSRKHITLVQQSCYGHEGEPNHFFIARQEGKKDFISNSLFGALEIYNNM